MEQLYTLGEEPDLVYGIALLMYKLGDYELSLFYFMESMHIYGGNTGSLSNIASCHFLMGDYGQAIDTLREALSQAPDQRFALDLLAKCRKELAPSSYAD